MRFRRKYSLSDLNLFCDRCGRHLWTFTDVKTETQAEAVIERIGAMRSLHRCKKGRHRR